MIHQTLLCVTNTWPRRETLQRNGYGLRREALASFCFKWVSFRVSFLPHTDSTFQSVLLPGFGSWNLRDFIKDVLCQCIPVNLQMFGNDGPNHYEYIRDDIGTIITVDGGIKLASDRYSQKERLCIHFKHSTIDADPIHTNPIKNNMCLIHWKNKETPIWFTFESYIQKSY